MRHLCLKTSNHSRNCRRCSIYEKCWI